MSRRGITKDDDDAGKETPRSLPEEVCVFELE